MKIQNLMFLMLVTVCPTFIFAQEIVESNSEDDKLSYSVELANATEAEFAEGKYEGLESEIEAEIGLNYQLLDNLSIGANISSYSDLYDEKSDPNHKFSTYLYEERLAGNFLISYSPVDFFTFNSGVRLELNIRPDDEDSSVRMGFGFLVGLEFEFEEQFISTSIENLIAPVFGIGNSNTLLQNDFEFAFRYDVFNYLKEDLNLGLYILSEFEAQNYFNKEKNINGDAIYLDHEFFAGFVYNPVDFFECSAALALFNAPEDESNTDLGIKLSAGFAFENVSFELVYKPHLWSKVGDVVSTDPVHVLEFGASLSF